MPERSFTSGNFYMPLCARCTGIYSGFLLSLIFIIILERTVKGKFPSIKMVMISVGGILVMGAEAVLSTFLIIESFGTVRFITGFMAGWFIAYLLLPLKNSAMFYRYRNQHYLENTWKFIGWLLIAPAMILLFIYTYRIALLFWSLLAVTGMLFFISFVLLIIFFSLAKRLAGSIRSWKTYIISISSGLLCSAAVISFFSFIRRFLI
ncbi:MAG: DUF2085 domain-containing protein [Actinobacteria bacterium]|nr:DUF2085 domain-containing protein [Actinomycetota bacterium]